MSTDQDVKTRQPEMTISVRLVPATRERQAWLLKRFRDVTHIVEDALAKADAQKEQNR